jgi:outer membrane receptor protein involved in Fe transport
MNLRLAGYQTVARPDPREIIAAPYTSVTGECEEIGSEDLVHTRIVNADVRWEWYPGSGELVSASGFYKRFDEPIVQLVGSSSAGCTYRPTNLGHADNVGVEVEARKNLAFLAERLESWTAGFNFTWVTGAAKPKPGDQSLNVTGELPLQDQSEVLVNASVGYTNREAGLDFTILHNYFTDRIRRYGAFETDQGTGERARRPDVKEQGRHAIDLKVRKVLGPWSISVSGSNLLGADQVRYHDVPDVGRVRVGFVEIPVSFGLSATYSF